MKTKLLILAAGLGTRNAAFTLNQAMSKIMLSTGNKTMLEKIIDSYNLAPIDEIVIVCMKEHLSVLEEFTALKMPDTKVTFSINNELNGTTKTVLRTLKRHTEDNDSWYINWSDVYAKCKPVHRTTIFTDSVLQHRNKVAKSYADITVTSTPDLSGNVAGIFYLDKKTTSLLVSIAIGNISEPFLDFDNLLANLATVDIELVELNDVVDLGDAQKHAKYLVDTASKTPCRYFNSLTFNESTVLKTPRTDEGLTLHEIELNYYRRLPENKLFAKLLDYDEDSKTMVLERIQGTTAQEHVNKTKDFEDICDKFVLALGELTDLTTHAYADIDLPTESEMLQALKNELYHGLDKRVLPLKKLIDTTIDLHRIDKINGMPITKNYLDVKILVSNFLRKYGNTIQFALCHGDTNTDNTMVDVDGNIKFIDPRGYFGGLNLIGYGPVPYDIAKFIYGLTGYSAFNSSPYITTTVLVGDMNVTLADYPVHGMFTYDLDAVDIQDEIKFIIGIIWMRLCTYISNDPVKSTVAYLHGNAIVTKYADKLGINCD